MPIILPPDDMTIDPQEESKNPEKIHTWEEYRRSQIYGNVPPWKCKCGIVNFGRQKLCVGRICKSPPCDGIRPADYKMGDPTKPGNDFNPWKVD